MLPRSRPRRSPSDSSGRVVCFSLFVPFLPFVPFCPFWYLDTKGGEVVLGGEFVLEGEFIRLLREFAWDKAKLASLFGLLVLGPCG